MTRAGEYVRAVVAQRHECAAGGTPVAGDGRVVFALGQQVAKLPLDILMAR
jgi:hypothetical protein